MIVVEIIQYCLAAIISILVGYQTLLSFLALTGGRIKDFKTTQNRKFAIIIPLTADDEGIAQSLYSVSGLVYPKNMYDLIVISENSAGDSASIARNLGAVVLERPGNIDKSNDSLLQWAVDQILNWDEQYDAITVFDSDTLVSGNYLEVMNYYLEQGSDVIQSSGLIPPKSESWTEIDWIEFLLDNYVKPMGRKKLGLGAGLFGNGMCFKAEVLRNIPWQTPSSLSDDFGYELALHLKGITVDFSPEAYIWSQKPAKTSSIKSKDQQSHWLFGRSAILKKYTLKLQAAAFRKQPIQYLDRIVDFITPSFTNSLLFIGLLCGLNGLLVMEGLISINLLWIWLGLAGIELLYLLMGVMVASKSGGYTLEAKTAEKEKVRDGIV